MFKINEKHKFYESLKVQNIPEFGNIYKYKQLLISHNKRRQIFKTFYLFFKFTKEKEAATKDLLQVKM